MPPPLDKLFWKYPGIIRVNVPLEWGEGVRHFLKLLKLKSQNHPMWSGVSSLIGTLSQVLVI